MEKYRIYDQHGLNYLTLTTVGWVDIFTRQNYRDILIESLKYCQAQKGLVISAYVIMSNHVHMIVSSEQSNLSDVLRDFKKFTSKAIIRLVSAGQRSGKKVLFSFHLKAFLGRIAQLFDLKKAQSGKKRAFLPLR